MTAPNGLALPVDYPAAGGVAIVMIGANGNAYFQFSNPTGAFQGYQNTGTPTAFQGNPFTVNSPISINCGFSSCTDYFGGSIAQLYIRFTAQDGDTGPGEFDLNDITLRLNGFDITNWSGVQTEITNTAGTVSSGFVTGFTNNTFNTGWFSSSNPALLSNILTTGRTTATVFDRDPNDNYWDFRIGNTLANTSIVTVAPGYSLTKTPSTTTYTTVGQQVTFTYVVANIGSVAIRNITVVDDKISGVTCDKTTILASAVNAPPPAPDRATCTGVYTITQADIDNRSVTNVAIARGTPDFGTLGERRATVTINGPALTPSLTIDKATTATAFGLAGTTVPYTFTVRNTGNVTLTGVVATDPLIPGLSCTVASLPPQSPGNVLNCSGTYTVTQANVDAWARTGTQLSNTANVTSRDPLGTPRTATDTNTLPGPTPVVTLTLDKVAQVATFNAVGNVIPYRITIRNTGNVTWPAAPTVADTLTTVACPAGTVAPGASIVCTSNYTVTQANIDAGSVANTASTSVTVGTTTGTANDTETVNATRTTGMTLDKRLAAASPTSFNNSGIVLLYEFAVRNTGNVTLNSIAVTDPLATVSCPTNTVAPGATLICTASYTTTQANLDAGQVVNTAGVTGRAAGTNTLVTGPSDSQTVPAVRQPALTMDKTAPVVSALDFQVGRTVTYSYLVSNTGNVALPGPILVQDNKAGTFQCQAGGLARGAIVTCTRNYVLTTADDLAGAVQNTATGTAGTTTTGITTSNLDTATIAPTRNPSITLAKSATPTAVSSTSTVITYSFTVTNTGDTRITRSDQPITVTDARVGTVTCPVAPAVLRPATGSNPGDSVVCTATTTATQAELDAGRIINRATASFPYTQGGQTITISSPEATNTVTATQAPALTVTKTGPVQFATVGQVISYNFAVLNTGNVTLTSGSVTDPRIPTLSCTITNLAPGATRNCTNIPYTVTQADIDAGQIVNTATATAATAQGGSATDTDTLTTPIAPGAGTKIAAIDKVAGVGTFVVGQRITYTVRVSNTGTQTLSAITVTDPLSPGYTCAIPTLAPGVTSSICTFPYTATQPDVDAGQILNTASAASPDFTTITDSVTVTSPGRVARYAFTKVASAPFSATGQVVDFTLRVRNTGTVTLTNVQITDAFFNPDLTCTIASLAPGADNSTCVGSYTTTQADVDAGRITNTASITVVPPSGMTPTGPTTATAVVPGPALAPSIVVTKVPSATSFAIGDTITYDFTVQNTGNVTLQNTAISDTALGFSCTLANLAPGATATACANATPLQASRLMTQADLDRGFYDNRVVATANSVGAGTAVTDDDQVTVVGPVQAPDVSVTKTGTPGTFDTVGQTISYAFIVTNTGNITLTAPVTVADDLISTVTCPAAPQAGIPPNGTLTCTATARVTQANLDDGFITNTATASVRQPVVPRNPGDPTTIVATSDPVTETVTADQQPELTMTKAVATGSARSYAAVGDQITFAYTITNTGNVTTTAPITLVDNKIPGTFTCSAAPLAPGASVTCTQVWTADQAAVDAPSTTNIATASTVFDGTPVPSNDASATVPSRRDPQLTISKSLVAPFPAGFDENEVLNYTYVVTNTGNVTITGPVSVADNLVPSVSCPAIPANLAPNASVTCTGSYTITQNDLQLGSTTNIATGAGLFDGNTIRSTPDSVIYPVDPVINPPALTILKEVIGGATFDDLTDVVTYRYTVTNTGGTGFVTPILVSDDKIGSPAGTPFVCDPPTRPLARGASRICTVTYPISQADLDRGFVTNTATGRTVFAPGTANEIPVESAPDDATATARTNPELTVTKSVVPATIAASLGDLLTYRLIALNSGNQTISGVTLRDPKVPTLTCTVGGNAAPANVVLIPAASLVCEGTYRVTQADIDAQDLPNTATARGTSPQGTTVTDTGSFTQPLVADAPAVTVTKAVTPNPGTGPAFTGVGDPVTFTVTVANTGNVTLTSTTVTDDLVSGTCTVGSLAPGEQDTSCQFTYFIKQLDMDRVFGVAPSATGGFVNTATAVSQPATPGASTVTDEGPVTAIGPVQERKFSLTKTATEGSFDAQGDVINYTFIVRNAGNITLIEQPRVSDPTANPVVCDAIPTAGLAPGGTVACTATYTVTQADVDAGNVVNVARAESDEVPLPGVEGAETATETVPATRNPAATVAKVASIPTNAQVGDDIIYTYTVTNTGNVTLTAVTPTDEHTSAAGPANLSISGDALLTDVPPAGNSVDAIEDGVWDTLRPGDAVTFTASYPVQQEDIDAGDALTNTVTVAATPPVGTSFTPPSDTVDVPVTASTGSLDVQKTADVTGVSTPPVPGDLVTYTITVANSGNITLREPTLDDTLTDANGTARNLTTGPDFVSGDINTDAFLNVGETWTYTATVVLTQAIINAGGLSNTVQATSVDPKGNPVSDTSDDDAGATDGNGDNDPTNDPTITPLTRAPTLATVKSAVFDDRGNGATNPGDTITYTYSVENTGNVTILDVSLAETGFSGAGTLPVPAYLSGGVQIGGDPVVQDLRPGDSVRFRVTYTLVQADVDAGRVTNQATATGTDPAGNPVTDLSGATAGDDTPTVTTFPRAPGIVVGKTVNTSALASPPVVGNVLTYTITVRNTGNVTLTTPVLTDTLTDNTNVVRPLTTGPTLTSGDNGNTRLDVGETWTYTATLTLTQAILDAGGVSNTVTATSDDPAGDPITDTVDNPVVTPFTRTGAMDVVKTLTNRAALTNPVVGNTVSYTITVANTGNVTLTTPVLTDTLTNGTGGTIALTTGPTFSTGNTDNDTSLDVGETWTYLATVTLTQAMIDSGGLSNTVTALADDPAGNDVTDTSRDGATNGPTVIAFPANPAITTVKSAVFSDRGNGRTDPGDTITYTYRIRNAGNTTLFDITVAETGFAGAGTAPTPAYVSGGGSYGRGAAADLRPGETAVFTAVYALRQADVDGGEVENQATGAGTTPAGGTVTDLSGSTATNDTPTVTPFTRAAALEVIKLADVNALSNPPVAGETVTFTITAENTGNVTLSTVTITDTLTRNGGATLTLTTAPTLTGGDGGVAGALEVNETWTYTATYTLVQADIDAAGIANTATVRTRDPANAVVSDVSDDGLPGGANDPTLVPLTASPRIEGEKTITAGPVTVGSRVAFLITARNSGNVTLNSVSVASDRLRRADGAVLALSTGPTFVSADQGSASGQLQPGETASYEASYVLVQADIDAGGITNSATVRGTPPTGSAVTDVTDDGDNADGNTSNDVTELPIARNPAMRLVKQTSVVSFDAVGDVIAYTFRITNTGNVTLADQIVINDPLITNAGGTITCPAPPVAPLATITCTGSYTITQADLDAGEVVNAATASDGATTSNPSGRTVPAVQTRGLAVLKEAAAIDPADFEVGLVVNYTYTVTNTGNVTVTAPITITDNLIDAATLSCPALPAAGLAPVSQVPAAALVCTGSYTVTVDDVDTGSVTNLASASDGTTTSPTTSETIPDAAIPALTITKTAGAGATFTAVGDQIDYTFVITNTGSRAYVRAITVEDDNIGSIACFTPSAADPNFTSTETITCTGSYIVTQDDLDAGEVVNEAYARTTINGETIVITSPPVTETVAAALAPALTVVKTATPNPVTAVGQVVTYEITVSNTGNQTIRGVEVTDPLLPDLTCAVAVLAVNADLVCSDTYTVTQADIDRQTLVNTATATGRAPGGDPVTDDGSVTTDLPDAAPALTIVKTATPSPFGAVGSNLTYRFRVENTGNLTLTNLVVTDPIDPAYTCSIGTLAPGAFDRSCTLTLQVTQAQVDAGDITNTASVTGDDPTAAPITDEDTITTEGPASAPGLEATKVLLPSATVLGTPVPYELRVANTGNVTITPAAPIDTMTRADGTATALDAPFTLQSGDADRDGRLDVGETWVYTATHTLMQADIDAGGLSNTVTVNGVGPGNEPVTDVSDNGDDSDGNTVDDPTVLTIIRGPALTVTKVVTAQDGVAAGDDITFTITALNSGNTSLSDVAITDTLTRADGTALTARVRAVSVPNPLRPGVNATWRVVHRLTQADVDAGGIRNTATVSGDDPAGEPVTDVSADGDNGDGNTTDDPTEVLISNAPAIVVEKRVTSIGDVAGEEAVFAITVRNAGNVTLNGVTVVDKMTRKDGVAVRPVTTAFVRASRGSDEGRLLPAETATYRVTYTLKQADIDAGGLVNTATATGTPPGGGAVTDISDDDGGTGEDDPTVAPIVPLGTVAVTKAAGTLQALFPTVDRVTFTITVENTGNVTQTRLRVADDLAAFLAPAQLLAETYPVVVTATGFGAGNTNADYDGTTNKQLLSGNATLAPGATGTITVTLVYSTAAGQPGGRNIARVTGPQLPDPEPSNPVTTGRTDTDGDGVPDDTEGPGDRDGDGVPNAEDYDPTGAFYCEEDGRLLTGGSINVVRSGGGSADGITIVRNGNDGQYQFYVTAPGTYRLEISYPPGGGPATDRPTAGRLDLGALIPEDLISIGSSEAGTTGVLANGSAAANPYYTTFVVVEGAPYFINNNIPVVNCTAGVDVSASKTADRTTAVFGETINYTLTFANDLATVYPDATFVDILPAGLVYTRGSARLNGVAIEPTIRGKRLIWGPRTLSGGETLTIKIAARVTGSADVGELENRAVMLDADGNEISNTPSAIVKIVPEAIFDCSDVIGKVFDDRNGNGIQDYYDPKAAVTNQDYYQDKYGKLGEPELLDSEIEPGIPGVRVVTVNGLLITTDEYGRFHVPCAALPGKTGSNFTLKLDTRTLPTGYALTTENPRTLRLTAGKVAKMNFGVAATEMVDIALTAQAFVAGTTDPQQGLIDGVAKLVKRIADAPSTLRLTYLMAGNEDEAGALARLAAVEKIIRRAWRGVGSYDLNVQKSVGRVQ